MNMHQALASAPRELKTLFVAMALDLIKLERAHRTSNRRFWASVICNVVLLAIVTFR